MFKKTIPFAIALLILLATVSTAFAITFGEPDTGNDYPFVGTLLFITQDPEGNLYGYWSCSGTLLSPTVMLTAGHCTSEFGQTNYATWVSLDQQITFEGRENYSSTEEYLNAEWITATAIPHPSFLDFSAFPNTFDVGVVLLDEPVYLDEYGELPDLGLLDELSKGQGRKDRQFTAVGYGLQGYIKPFYIDLYERYLGEVSLIEVKSTFNGDGHSAKFSNNPGKGNGSGGTCFGDSGGPLFHKDSNVIGAVVSWGITPCVGVDYQFRIDTPIAQDFVKGFLP